MSRLMTKPAKWTQHVRPAKTQISLDPSFLHADSEDSGRMPRLIWIIAGRTCHFCWFCHEAAQLSLKSDPNFYTALFGSDDILLRVVSDWPFNEPMESLLPAAHGAKCKITFDVTDVMFCKHSEPLAPFSCLYHFEMISTLTVLQ